MYSYSAGMLDLVSCPLFFDVLSVVRMSSEPTHCWSCCCLLLYSPGCPGSECCQERLVTSGPPASPFQVLGFELQDTYPGLCSAGDQTQSLVCAGQAVYPLTCLPGPLAAIWTSFFECCCEGQRALVTIVKRFFLSSTGKRTFCL